MDHSDSIASAYKEHWPDIVLLNCWPHLAGNLPKKKTLLTDVERYEGILKSQFYYLHKAHNASHFLVLSTLITKNWLSLGENVVVSWFKEEYLSATWKLWYYTASRSPGVTPNQNAIGSHNRDIKRVVDPNLYASTKVVMNLIPKPITPYAEGPVPIECARKAHILTENGNFWPLINRQRSKVTAILFNIRAVMIGGKAVNPTPIDADRTQMYVDSRKGRQNQEDGAEQVEQHYLTLHLVQLRSDESFEHNWSWSEKEVLTIRRKMLCDCKGFYETGWICAHILATLAINDEFTPPLAAEIVTRSKTTRPSTKNAGGETKSGQYSVPKLIEKLTSSPGSVIEWYVLIRRESLGGSGAKNFTGVIRPWEEGDEKYFWVVGFDHGAAPDAELDIEELAEILNYTYPEKYDFIQ
ncbi:hypothetical protein JG688_00012170 [Phytophthora aleatoria]|uniref:SWIM-type domain-containing protein n=1 Tax=Phytophthora aleatoria TaxID=2496075 RepID=A0A8J5MEU3_9STRA|nr:hypothetical protein JG688_00012170 [Phytophthora aleatoria]